MLVALLVAVLAATTATSLAQTVDAPVVEETGAGLAVSEIAVTPASDVAVEVEMQRRFNEFRSQYLDDRADSINWWLTVVAIVIALFGIAIPVAFAFGVQRFRYIESEARKHVDEIKSHKVQAERVVDNIRGITAQDVADPVKSKQAEKFIESALQTSDVSPIVKAIAMAHSLQKAGEIEKAIEKWRSIAHLMEGINNKIAADAWFSVGYLLSGNPKVAISAYDQAIRLDPNDSAAYSNRGSAKSDLGQHEEAIKDCDESIRLDPSNSAAYSNRSRAKGILGQYEEAIKDCDEAIRLDPRDPIAYSNRGNVKSGLGKHEEAIKDCDKAIFLDPNYFGAYINRGKIKNELKQHEEAIKDYNRAIILDPNYSGAYNNRGKAKIAIGQHEDAIKDFDESVRLNPRNHFAYFNRGLAKNCLKRIEGARSDFQTALPLVQEDGNEELVVAITEILRKIDTPEKS